MASSDVNMNSSEDDDQNSITLTGVDLNTVYTTTPNYQITSANIGAISLGPLYDDGSLVITKSDGTSIDVANNLDNIDVRLEVISEVLDEIIMQTGLSSRATIQERVEQKLMLRRLSGQKIPRIK